MHTRCAYDQDELVVAGSPYTSQFEAPDGPFGAADRCPNFAFPTPGMKSPVWRTALWVTHSFLSVAQQAEHHLGQMLSRVLEQPQELPVVDSQPKCNMNWREAFHREGRQFMQWALNGLQTSTEPESLETRKTGPCPDFLTEASNGVAAECHFRTSSPVYDNSSGTEISECN